MRAERNVWKGLAAGAPGGLAASAVIDKFQALWALSLLKDGRLEAS